MKLTQLRKLIREEISKAVNENERLNILKALSHQCKTLTVYIFYLDFRLFWIQHLSPCTICSTPANLFSSWLTLIRMSTKSLPYG